MYYHAKTGKKFLNLFYFITTGNSSYSSISSISGGIDGSIGSSSRKDCSQHDCQSFVLYITLDLKFLKFFFNYLGHCNFFCQLVAHISHCLQYIFSVYITNKAVILVLLITEAGIYVQYNFLSILICCFGIHLC